MNTLSDYSHTYTDQLLELIQKRAWNDRRSYGFEYEFMPVTPLSLKDMDRLYNLIIESGFKEDGSSFYLPLANMYISFEPGGQIEYHSPPMFPDETDLFYETLNIIDSTNAEIFRELGIQYVGTGFIKDRHDAPLCLTAKRYKNMHARMPSCGSRGLEMMKGTASIHLHVAIKSIDELPLLFLKLREMSFSDDFKMQPERSNIWKNTDPTRCGLPFKRVDTPQELINEIVRFTLKADDIGEGIPFETINNITFDSFLYHMTTIFTDVRLNIKGPTFELRTLDSMPLQQFETKWKKFIKNIENIYE